MKWEGARSPQGLGSEARRQCWLRYPSFGGLHVSAVSPAGVTSCSLRCPCGSMPRESRVELVLGKACRGLVHLIISLGGVPSVSVTDKDVHGAPITSDFFSQKCGWSCSVPSALSHWPPHPAICLQAVRRLAGVRGTPCDHRMHNIAASSGRTLEPSPRSPRGPS